MAVRVRLGPPRKARGEVLGSSSEKPIPQSLVWACGPGAPGRGGVSDTQGGFEILFVGSGRPTLGADRRDRTPTEHRRLRSDGLFTLTGLGPGRYEVTAESPMGNASGLAEVGNEGGRIELRLEAATPDS